MVIVPDTPVLPTNQSAWQSATGATPRPGRVVDAPVAAAPVLSSLEAPQDGGPLR